MDAANPISGLPSLGSDVPRRPLDASARTGTKASEGEVPVSGIAPLEERNRTVAATEESGKSDKRQVAEAVKNMNDFLQMIKRTIEFKMDEDSGRLIVQVKDVESGKVIRQIPPENLLKLSKELDKFKGLLFESTA